MSNEMYSYDIEYQGWGGFVDGKLQCDPDKDGYSVRGLIPCIYTSKRAAKARFEDVRKVRIIMEGSHD